MLPTDNKRVRAHPSDNETTEKHHAFKVKYHQGTNHHHSLSTTKDGNIYKKTKNYKEVPTGGPKAATQGFPFTVVCLYPRPSLPTPPHLVGGFRHQVPL